MSPVEVPEGGPEALVGLDFECDCGRRHKIEVKKVVVGSGVVRSVPRILGELGLTGRFALAYDRNVEPLAGRTLFPVLDRPGIRYESVCYRKEHELHASVESSDELRSMLPPAIDFLMVMGSGTMNDLGKWAATVLDIPYVVIATAPSMNGYTSSISALSEGAFKSTQDVRPAAAVIADVDIMKDAPIEMIRAGMGDLLSKNVCNADWRLSHRLKDTYFCELPHRLTRGQERYYFEHARELGRRDSEAVRMLTEAVMNSGFSMAIVGLASPSSGSEHLMSHYWEMQNEMAGRALSLHGAQVGVGTLIAAEIYERVLRMGPGGIDLERARRSYRSLEELKPVVSKHYGPLADRTFEHTARKVVPWPETERQLITLKEDWDDIWRDVGRFLRTRAELEHVMREAGCPTRASDLNISRDDTYNAIRYARLLRNRYTILDVADEAGWLEHWADDLADEFTG